MMTIFNAKNATELMSALSSANGGETIMLAPGEYGDFALYSKQAPDFQFSDTVTIKSTSAENPATFSSVTLQDVGNLAFDAVKFDYVAPEAAPDWARLVDISKSSNISITNSVFDGDLAHGEGGWGGINGFGTGVGLSVILSENINLEGNEFFDFGRAALFTKSDELRIVGNDVHDIRSDGFNFVQVNDALIEGNHIHDFRTAVESGDHADMIQFWTSGTESPSTNVTIRSNILQSGEGGWTQSIFMRNEAVDYYGAGLDMYYRNISIEDNVIVNAHSHGISVGETDGLRIGNNTILQNRDTWDAGLVSVPAIGTSKSSTGVVIENNIVSRPIDDISGASIHNNLIVQRDDPDAANYYGDLFVNALADSAATLQDLRAVPNGVIQQMGVGALMTRFNAEPDTPSGYIENEAGTKLNLLTHDFSFSNLYGPHGAMDLADADVVWDFGDGAVGSDFNTQHTYGKAGAYNVTATVTLADGQSIVIEKTIEVETPVLLHADFNNNTAADQSDLANKYSIGDDVTYESNQDGGSVRPGSGVVSYNADSGFFNNSEYSVLFDFQKEQGSEAGSGRAIYFPGSFVINIDGDGVSGAVYANAEAHWFRANNAGISDAEWHKVALTFSGELGVAVVYVDGVEVARVDGLEGASQMGIPGHKFSLGDPFGGNALPGLIDNVTFLRGALAADEVLVGSRGVGSTTDTQSGQPVVDQEPLEQTPPSAETPPPAETPDQSAVTPITGGNDGDLLFGADGDDMIEGKAGNDYVGGGAGNDALSGGSGYDYLLGGEGNDALDGGDESDQLFGGNGDDVLFGAAGNDALYGDSGEDRLHGNDGSDRLHGGDGSDVIYGNAGIDVLAGEAGEDILFGGEGRDRLFGGADNDYLDGGDADDGLFGGGGEDTLVGGRGRDGLHGDSGNDVLVGGEGNDDLHGGAGTDVFVFGVDSGKDRILDFEPGQDTITLQGLDFATADDVIDGAFDVRGDLVLNLDTDGSTFSWGTSNYVVLVGIDKDDLVDGNISLVA